MPGREAETAALVGLLAERRIVAVVAPRRFGKTSLVQHALAVADDVDPAPWQVTVDLFGLSSVSDFAVRLERAMGDLRGGAARTVAGLLAGGELGLSINPGVGIKARLGDRNAPDPVRAVHELVDALVTASDPAGGLLFLDEFQDIAAVDGLDGVLRSHLQHAHRVGVVMAGSRPSMMRSLFTDQVRAFYAQAELFELGPLDRATATAVVLDGFDATGRDGTAVADRVVAFGRGHPQRLMLLADHVWRRTGPGRRAGADDFADGLTRAREATAPEFEATWRRLSESARDSLRSVVRFGSPAARAGERFLDLNAGSASSAARSLVDDAVLVNEPGTGWRLVDPFFADWIDRTLP